MQMPVDERLRAELSFEHLGGQVFTIYLNDF